MSRFLVNKKLALVVDQCLSFPLEITSSYSALFHLSNVVQLSFHVSKIHVIKIKQLGVLHVNMVEARLIS